MGAKPRGMLSPLDLIGAVLLGAWATWVAVSSFTHGADFFDALPYLTAPTFAVLGVLAGRRLHSNAMPTWFPAFLLALAAFVLLSVTVFGGAGGAPLGYSNANAALAIQLAAVAAVTAMGLDGEPRKRASWAAALFALAVPWTLSQAGIALLIPFLAAVLVATFGPARRGRWVLPTAALSVIAAAITVVNIARTSEWPEAYQRAFSGVRRQLWSEALGLWARHPVAGGGPGSFRAVGGVTLDSDTERVHMSVLQVASELGAIGVLLFGALGLLALVMLAPAQPRARLVGAAAVASLFIHSFVDHLFEFPAITLAAGTVIGLAGYSRSGVK